MNRLLNDEPRCQGRTEKVKFSCLEKLREPCITCVRQTAPPSGGLEWRIVPPRFDHGKCPRRISPHFEAQPLGESNVPTPDPKRVAATGG